MSAVLIYVPGGKINKWAYEGALQQAEAMKKVMGENTEMIGMININRSSHEVETEEDREKAERFIQLAHSGKPVIAMIQAREYEEAYYKLAQVVSPDSPFLHPSQVAIVNALQRPRTDEEWKRSVDWTVARALIKFKPAAQGSSPE
jgi:recombinational DNA repair protein RecR